MSLAINYPDEALIQAWRSGDFSTIVDEALRQAQAEPQLHQANAELASAIQTYFSSDRNSQDLQADYVSLFELNHEQPPLHLLQHLYNLESHASQLDLYRDLQARYRSCGITLKQGEGGMLPDQLSVQVEFMAYLCTQLAQENTPEEISRLGSMLADTAQMLHWIDTPIATLGQRPHQIYFPLLCLLRDILDLCARAGRDID